MGYYWTCPEGHVCMFGDDEESVCYQCPEGSPTPEEFEELERVAIVDVETGEFTERPR